MQRFRFKKGLRFHDGDHQWTLLRETATKKLLFQSNQGVSKEYGKDQVLSLWNQGDWRIEEDCLEEIHDVIYLATPGDLNSLSESKQQGAIRRARYLTGTISDSVKLTLGKLKPLIKKVAADLQDPSPPHPTTVMRWLRRWGQSKDSTKLVDRRSRSGRKTNADVYSFFEKAIDTVFLSPQKNPGTAVLNKIVEDIDTFNKKVAPEHRTPMPSRTTVYRWLDGLHAYVEMEAREGKKAAKLKYRSVTETVEVNYILERVEIDHTPLDLMIIDEFNQLPLGRPWLTLAIDRYSRVILGFYLAFHGPSSYSVMRCLKRCVLPKAEWMKELGDFKNSWPMHGIPMEVVFDNGMDLHSDAVSRICYEMGCRVSFCPTGEPYFKGAIERMFGSLNTGLIHQLPGTTFSNVKQRGDYPSEAKAVLTLTDATRLIAMWIVDTYHQRRHRSTGETPHARWCRQLASVAIEFPANPEQLDVLVGIPAQRQKITHEGILFETIHYNNADLQFLSQRIGRKRAVQFKYFEEDVGYIQVYDEERREYIRAEAAAKYAEYANGLSRQLHLVTRRWAEKIHGADWQETHFIESRRAMETLVQKATHAKKMTDRKKSAAARGIHSDRKVQDFDALATARLPRAGLPNFPPEFSDACASEAPPVFGINRIRSSSTPKTY